MSVNGWKFGWKIVRPDGTTYGGFAWPLVNAKAGQAPVRVETHGWVVSKTKDKIQTHWRGVSESGLTQGEFTTVDPCPAFTGDGLCIAKTAAGASSGGIALSECVGLILFYKDTDILVDGCDKIRVKACTVVDVWSPLNVIRNGGALIEAGMWNGDLRSANLYRADLSYADLRGADMRSANLRGCDLSGTKLDGCNLKDAVANAHTIWPKGFRWGDAGVVMK